MFQLIFKQHFFIKCIIHQNIRGKQSKMQLLNVIKDSLNKFFFFYNQLKTTALEYNQIVKELNCKLYKTLKRFKSI